MTDELTRTAKTEAVYAKTYTRLARTVAKALGHEAGPMDVVEHLVALRPEVRAVTFRGHRSAVAHVLEEMVSDTGSPTAREALGVLERTREEPLTDRKPLPPRTSGLKQKNLNPDDVNRLLVWLVKSKRSWGKLTALWLRSSLHTGLRPIEWTQAELLDDFIDGDDPPQPALIVRNAKATNRRGHGPTRTVLLGHLPDKVIGTIRAFVHDLNFHGRSETEKHQALAYRHCAALLAEANQALWPKRKQRITLYSGRHAFAAALKGDADPDTVAAVMGHINVETAYEHYGRAPRKGSKRKTIGPVARPSKADVLKVEATGKGVRTRSPEESPRRRRD